MLLYGPPGTGKTLMARQIGKILNGKDPKISLLEECSLIEKALEELYQKKSKMLISCHIRKSMEDYNIPEHGHADAYLIHHTESNPVLTSPLTEQFEAMYNNGASEFALQHGLYHLTANNFGYISVGMEFMDAVYPNSTREQFMDAAAFIANRTDVPGLKHNLSSASAAFKMNPSRITSDLTNSFARTSGGSRINVGPSKQPFTDGSASSNGYSNATAMSNVFQGRGTQIVDNLSQGKVWSNRNQFKVAQPGSGLSSFSSSAQRKTMIDKVQTKFNVGSISPDVSSEHNRGPRTSKLTNQLDAKAYTSMAGESDAQGSVVIDTNQYNKDDFTLDYVNMKFFIIKSYSEDDVHKSIKLKSYVFGSYMVTAWYMFK